MLAVDLEWAGETDGNLCHPCEVLNVPFGGVGVEGELSQVLQLFPGVGFDETLPLSDDALLVIDGAVTRDAHEMFIRLGNGVIHTEAQLPEGLGFEDDLDLVLAHIQGSRIYQDVHRLTQGEVHWGVGGDLVGVEFLPIPQVHADGLFRDRFPIDLNAH